MKERIIKAMLEWFDAEEQRSDVYFSLDHGNMENACIDGHVNIPALAAFIEAKLAEPPQ